MLSGCLLFHVRKTSEPFKSGKVKYLLEGLELMPIPWPPAMKRQLIGKDSDTGKDLRQIEKWWHRMRWS